ncbi:MAG: tRNA-dihydrouridine synthase family protein [Proteobacteria bacterium]|nr:tRNA-dihydrouridine synthase family protein [Pseudomonadota bacterium]MBU1686669.1 tRNA-dihydrouridine synthase family protein [Pseudomonadota bacterium]
MPSTLPALTLRNLTIGPPLFLAPMAGLTHSALRQIIIGFGGVGLLSTEMLGARRLPSESPRFSPFLFRTDLERPLSYQLLTSSVTEIGPAIAALHKVDAEAIDLNIGCPSPRIGRFGAGASLMERPDEVRQIVAEARKCTDLPLTAKIRLGIEFNEPSLKEFCVMLEGEGIDLLTVHARLKKESFARKPHWEWVAKVKEWLNIPVIANGGIFSVADAENCLRISGADGLMIGRAAATTPWLFAELARKIYGSPIDQPVVSLPQVYFTFLALLEEHFRPERRLGRLKEFTHYFAQNFKFGHHLATRIQSTPNLSEARTRAEAFFADNPTPAA